jgi:ParB/RepB/Spo0J family partition protein
VSRLAQSIKEIGLQHPISVLAKDGRFILVAGRHRLEAMRQLGAEDIETNAVPMDDRDARMWTIAENLYRAELTVQERADQVQRETRGGKSFCPSWAESPT